MGTDTGVLDQLKLELIGDGILLRTATRDHWTLPFWKSRDLHWRPVGLEATGRTRLELSVPQLTTCRSLEAAVAGCDHWRSLRRVHWSLGGVLRTDFA
jgi:hypothetical protein